MTVLLLFFLRSPSNTGGGFSRRGNIFPPRREFIFSDTHDLLRERPFELDLFENQLEAKYESKKGGRLGPGPNVTKELTILNRVIRLTDRGIEYEADPRRGERLLEVLGLDGGCKSIVTPWLESADRAVEGGDRLLCVDGHTAFRALAARANHLG